MRTQFINQPFNFLRSIRSLTLSLLSVVVLASPAFAAPIPEVPSTAQPGQMEKRLPSRTGASKRLELNIPAPVETKALPQNLRNQLEKSKFTLNTVVLDGASVYSAQDVAFAYEKYIGKTISLLDAREIANNITTYYRNHGYILTQAVVPTQDVTKGVLKIRVVEGFIGKVSFEGDVTDESQQQLFAEYAENIKALRPANTGDLERYLLLMNDMPGSTITGLIRPSAGEFGAADLVLTVRRKMVDGAYIFDNRGSKYLGPFQHTIVVGANSMFSAYDRTQLRIMTVNPFERLFVAEAQHEETLNAEGTKFTITGSHTRTKPGEELKQYNIVGHSDLLEFKLSHPFERSRSQNIIGRAVFTIHNTSNEIFDHQDLTTDRLRVARLGATYSMLDGWQGSNSLDFLVSQGINIFEATDDGILSNPMGRSDFTKVNMEATRLQPLENNFSLLTSAAGQYSFVPLLVDEQFSLGGSDYGRAFDASEGLGDAGLAGKAELRWDDLVEEPWLDSYQLFTFADIGEVWKRAAPVGADEGTLSLASFGVGTRVKFTENFYGSAEANFPLIRPGNDPTGYRHNPRIYFSLSARF